MREALGDVVDRPLVAAVFIGNELGRERVETGCGDELLEREDIDPALEFYRYGLLAAGGGSLVVVGLLDDLQRAPGRFTGPDDHVDVDRFAFLHVGRDRHFLDQDLAVVAILDGHHVDLDAQRLGGHRLLEQVAAVLVAVGDHHHPPRRVFGKRRQCELEGCAGVGVLGVDHALDAHRQVELAGGRRHLDLGSLAEDDHARHIILAAFSSKHS